MIFPQASELYKEHLEAAWFDKLVSFLSSAPILVLLLAKEDVVSLWRDLIGPTSTKRAKEEKPNSIRAMFGTDNLMNAVFGSSSVENAKVEIEFFFNSEGNQSGDILEMDFSEKELEDPATIEKTLVLLKPDVCDIARGEEGEAEYSKKVDEIIQRILWSNFQIIKREQLLLAKEQAQELLYHYEQESWFEEMVSFVVSGPCIALVLRAENVVRSWRDIAGANDPDEAKQTAPMRYHYLKTHDFQYSLVIREKRRSKCNVY